MSEIVRIGYLHRAGRAAHGGVDGAGVEAIVDREIAGQRIVDAFLRFDGDDHAPAGHVLGPLDAMHPDIGAAIDGDQSVAMAAAAQIEKAEQERDIGRIVGLDFLTAGSRFSCCAPPFCEPTPAGPPPPLLWIVKRRRSPKV